MDGKVGNPQPLSAGTSRTRGRVLIVDDEESIVDVLAEFLDYKGYRVRAFTDPQRALRAIYEEVFDVIITDLKISDTSGMDIIKAVKNVSQRIPIIVVSGFLSDAVIAEAMAMGAYRCLRKPLDLGTILMAVEGAMERGSTSSPIGRGTEGLANRGDKK